MCILFLVVCYCECVVVVVVGSGGGGGGGGGVFVCMFNAVCYAYVFSAILELYRMQYIFFCFNASSSSI